MKDLSVLVADKTMEFTLRAGLSRPESLSIRSISVDFRQHPNRDGGSRTTGARLLSLDHGRFHHALMVLDHEGSGASESAVELEKRLDSELAGTWGDRAKAIVIDPELDVWIWGSDNLLAQVFAWPHSSVGIRDWLSNQGHAIRSDGKPQRPKESLEAVFAECRLPRSAANYQRVATQISLVNCQDPAFARLKITLQQWFGVN